MDPSYLLRTWFYIPVHLKHAQFTLKSKLILSIILIINQHFLLLLCALCLLCLKLTKWLSRRYFFSSNIFNAHDIFYFPHLEKTKYFEDMIPLRLHVSLEWPNQLSGHIYLSADKRKANFLHGAQLVYPTCVETLCLLSKKLMTKILLLLKSAS